MRLCRFRQRDAIEVGFYDDEHVVPLAAATAAHRQATGETRALPPGDALLDLLPPDGTAVDAVRKLHAWLGDTDVVSQLALPHGDVQLLVPIPRPPKLFLLAGNYAAHLEEGGEPAAEREGTFPYVFMKPPSTTLTNPGRPVRIPAISPDHIDWELELAVVIGRHAKGIAERDALDCVAGYTVINDISNRRFQPNPNRRERPRDRFFDWLHGKWFDSFCPCGPCVTSADAIPDPQALGMQLRVNDVVCQDASTSQQIFPVAAVIAFISSFVTLEPGDIISTGTPAGVGNAAGKYLKPGDVIRAHIDRIGTLESPVGAE